LREGHVGCGTHDPRSRVVVVGAFGCGRSCRQRHRVQPHGVVHHEVSVVELAVEKLVYGVRLADC